MQRTTLIIFFLSLFFFTQGQSLKQINHNSFWAGIPDTEFEAIQAKAVNGGKQVQSNWCWAACIQMVLNYHGLKVNQYQIIQKVFGPGFPNQAASEAQMLAALSGWAPDQAGIFNSIHAESGKTSVYQIIQALAYKWPLVVGVKTRQGGHAMVLTGISYQVNSNGDYVPQEVTLRDPSPGYQQAIHLDWTSFERQCATAIKVFVGKKSRMRSMIRD